MSHLVYQMTVQVFYLNSVQQKQLMEKKTSKR